MGYSKRRRIEERVAREIGLAFVLLGVVLAQTALIPRVFGFTINLLLVIVVCHALIVGTTSATRWAFYGGLSMDLCADSLLGSHTLALLAAVLLASLILARLSQRSWIMPLAGVAIGGLTFYLLQALIMTLLIAPIDLRAYCMIVALPATLVAMIPALPIFLFMRIREERSRGEVPVDIY